MKRTNPPFKQRVATAVADTRVQLAVLNATTQRDAKRRAAWDELPDVQAQRDIARQIKDHTLDHLDKYLAQFIEQLHALGVTVHAAETADDANRIVIEIAQQHDCRSLVKSKSMLTEELHTNEALAQAGLDVVETDLGEYLLQLDGDSPSHITAPAVHKDVASCAKTFAEHLGVEEIHDPETLVKIARNTMRDVYRQADMAVTGVNFAVAETGTLVLVMNEGNGRFCTLHPKVHVAMMGIEKLVPAMRDLAVLLPLLTRSATSQPLSVDTQFITGPRRAGDPDGPESMHVILVDAGRVDVLGSPQRELLRCIRCGACLNICPVYRSLGGHAYGGAYPGPIGAVLTVSLSQQAQGGDLPSASSLCGACLDACPVKIDIPGQLLTLREQAIGSRWENRSKSFMLRLAMWMMRSPWRYRLGQRMLRMLLKFQAPDGWVRRGVGPLRGWTQVKRDLPQPAPRSFRDLWKDEAER
jgi:L-lactate dehydrogenase complex protein LldF